VSLAAWGPHRVSIRSIFIDVMRYTIVLLLAAATAAGAQKAPVSKGRVAGELAAGFVGGPIGFALGYTIGSGFRPHGSSNSGVAAGFAGALLGPATAVNLVGNGGPSRGNFGATVGGAALGYAATYFVFPLATKPSSTKLKIIGGLVAFALPAVGATVAYNATRR
jgi:hypothetical protein